MGYVEMSRVFEALVPVGRLSGSRLHVMLVLASHYRLGAGAWPSVATIATKTNLSRSRTQELLTELRADGLIVEAQKGGGRAASGRGYTTRYLIPMLEASDLPPSSPDGLQTEELGGSSLMEKDATSQDLDSYRPKFRQLPPENSTPTGQDLVHKPVTDPVIEPVKDPVIVVAPAKQVLTAADKIPDGDVQRVLDAAYREGYYRINVSVSRRYPQQRLVIANALAAHGMSRVLSVLTEHAEKCPRDCLKSGNCGIEYALLHLARGSLCQPPEPSRHRRRW